MSKYKVGDKVKVREDLVVGEIYGRQITVGNMVELKGKKVTIKSVHNGEEYRIKELGYTWTNEMFEGLVDEPKYVKCITSEFRNIRRGEVYEVVGEYCGRYVLEQGNYGKRYFVEVETQIEEDFIPKTKDVSPKYVKCIDNIDGGDNGLELNKIYEVEYNFPDGYKLVGMNNYIFFKFRFEEVDTTTEPTQSIPNKGTIKYRITDDGIAYATLNGSKTGKSVKSGKDESRNEVGILISVARSLGFHEDKISGIVDVLFDDDSYNSKAKCDNAIMKNDIARALSLLDKYKE